ncbi:Tfp pilus assembly protein PilF [Sulfobacillus thermosulfidooxidans DSM 9293]|uniref:Tfp pilus assembly protein PilF n=1 Tax=Sulfobacillus thermosulfidooxidans (strain DSM 9293 / VKM B-1269 / AT-1) TaxID=929705 RepID=A0A1W1WJS6_SULTA|nr:tetratricopeptide repeat protein [Sulfobacillus thermosulfidooxidans]SMC06551.1 Tfp pilus assembly protein PilF [Sulfobacillus thermosulfidooxidans DSM 9293]
MHMMKKVIGVGFPLLLLPWLSACGSDAYLVPPQARNAPKEILMDQQAVEQRMQSIQFNLTRAITTEESAVVQDPTYAEGYSRLAQLFWQDHEPQAALIEAQKACQLQPSNVTYWNNLGQLALSTHHLRTASTAFHEALSHDPTNWTAYVGLGQAAIAQHQPNLAQVDATKALEFGGPQGPVFDLDGQVNQLKGNWNNAATFYRDAIAANPNWWQGYYDLAVVEVHWGEVSLAEQNLRQALSDNPGSSSAWLLLQSLPQTNKS